MNTKTKFRLFGFQGQELLLLVSSLILLIGGVFLSFRLSSEKSKIEDKENPANAYQAYRLGYKAQSEKDWEAAKDYYNRVFSFDDSDQSRIALFNLGVLAFQMESDISSDNLEKRKTALEEGKESLQTLLIEPDALPISLRSDAFYNLESILKKLAGVEAEIERKKEQELQQKSEYELIAKNEENTKKVIELLEELKESNPEPKEKKKKSEKIEALNKENALIVKILSSKLNVPLSDSAEVQSEYSI